MFLPPCPCTSIEHHTLRRQRCVPQYRRRKKRPRVRHVPPSCLVQCVGVFLSRLQEGNYGLAQANCCWLKNLQVAKKKKLGSSADTLTLNSILNYPESPPKSIFLSPTLFSLPGISFIHVVSHPTNICRTLTVCLRIGLVLGKFFDRNSWLPSKSRKSREGQVWAGRDQHCVASSLTKTQATHCKAIANEAINSNSSWEDNGRWGGDGERTLEEVFWK